MYMAMGRMVFTMIIIITGTTIIIALGGDIIDIDPGILGLITTSLIMDGHTTALIMHIILIPIMAITLIIIIMDRVTT